ncbi:TonB-dependent receptor [Tenacibaculum sp. 1_MG-2023]|uniref:SusC/RagA family TonB-linked outer membrane protein n=1 Tax=Tenacibaculum sp. 1_MG-2023 TaxID=3062653 RepID=UPI0026E17AD4|nr:TonB-dependent receptor [Tenacibaculum sp. 1_MG-2023]MDO6674856.1 TonB-dependent receptor [Tenacibaculum sp. 1_MG-2023]
MRTKFNGILTLFLALIVQISFAQERTISGTISDETGPLPGVTILKKGTTQGTETDFDGNYAIQAKTGDVLVFSFVGMKTAERTVGSSSNLSLVLQSDNVLDEVIVVGYGQVSQRDLTTNISSVKAESVQAISTSSIAGALQGTASGVQISQLSGAPGGEVRVRVRGASSINGSNNPLYVIDGIPMFSEATASDSFGGQRNSAVTNLNPDDIESIEILKDAASAAIYGNRGSNGVILITTKKGKAGKARFNISTTVGIQNPIKKYEVMNYGQWLRLGDAFYENSGFPSGTWSNNQNPGNNLSGADQATLQAYYDANSNRGDNYLDEIYVDNALVKNINANVSGGNEDTKYYFGIASFTQDGNLLTQDYERQNVRLNLTQKLSDSFKLTTGISLTDETTRIIQGDNNIFGILSTAMLERPGRDIYNEDGSFNSYTNFSFSNPVQNAIENFDQGKTFRILGNANLEYKVNDELRFNTTFGFDQLNFRQRSYYPSTTSLGAPNGSADQRERTDRKFTALAAGNYNKSFDNWRLRVFLGAEYEQNKLNFIRAAGNGFISPSLTWLASAANPSTATALFSDSRRVSFISRVGATIYEDLILEGSLRYDGSSRFNEDQRWGLFPAASLGYIISNNDWFKNNFVSYFKVRGSWGITGNVSAVGRYDSQPSVQTGNYGSVGSSYLANANPNLRWEETAQIDVGFEAKFFDDRVSLNYAYYEKETHDNSLILSTPLPGSQGGGGVTENVGSMINKGHEIDLKISLFNNDNFQWDTNIGFSSLDNKVTFLDNTAPFVTGFVSRIEEGVALGGFYGLQADGLYQDISEVPANLQTEGVGPGDVKYIDQNNDGLLNDDDYVVIGKPFADFTMNWSNKLKYKNFDLNFLWAWSEGNDVYNNTLAFTGSTGSIGFNKFVSQGNYWTPTNTNTGIPRPNSATQAYNSQDSSRYVEDGSFIKLRNITLGYNLPKIKGFDQVRLTLSGDNLIVITDYSGNDPEVNFSGGNSIVGGTDFLTQGGSKVVKVGVNVTF